MIGLNVSVKSKLEKCHKEAREASRRRSQNAQSDSDDGEDGEYFKGGEGEAGGVDTSFEGFVKGVRKAAGSL